LDTGKKLAAAGANAKSQARSVIKADALSRAVE
jgi:hypothetical protein